MLIDQSERATIDIATAKLILERPAASRDSSLLRGAVMRRGTSDSLWHQHDESGRVIYRYPLIHYRWQDRDPELVGFQAGAMAIEGADFTGAVLRIGRESIRVRRVIRERAIHSVGFAPQLRCYRFASPWLALGYSELARRYHAMDDRDRARELDRLAIGAVVTGIGGACGARIQGRVLAMVRVNHVGRYRYKEANFHGFSGDLLVNLDLPDGMAIGRAVSVGFGVIERDAEGSPC